MKRIKQLLTSALLLLVVGFTTVPALPVYAASASTTAACNAISDNKGCKSSGPSLNSIVTVVVNVLSVIIGVVSVIMIMVGGFRFVTSAGDAAAVKSARGTITYAIVGLVVVALAQFIVQFVLHKVTTGK